MAAVIRLKRHLDDEPLSALILNCKKRKKTCESDTTQEISAVLTFAGTINNQEDDISPHISKLSKDDIESSYKKHVPNITSKLRYEAKITSDDNRFKVVNLFRSIDKDKFDEENTNATSTKLPLTVFDVESSDYTNEKTTVERDNSDYVYDLYYTNSEGINDDELDSDYKICPANEIIFDDGLILESDTDSDDSNNENNWRNDYPDEESTEDDSINQDDMQKAIGDLTLNDLSSDDDENIGFTYSIDSEAVGCEEDFDPNDQNRYGEMFARFKRGQKKEEDIYNKDLYHEEVDDTDEDLFD